MLPSHHPLLRAQVWLPRGQPRGQPRSLWGGEKGLSLNATSPAVPLPHPSTCHDPWADTTTAHILLRWLRSEIRVWLDPGDPRGMAWAFPAATAAALSHPGPLPAPSLASCSSSIPQAPQTLPEAVGSSPWHRSPQLSAPLHSQTQATGPAHLTLRMSLSFPWGSGRGSGAEGVTGSIWGYDNGSEISESL